MADSKQIAMRADTELSAAAQALRHANALFDALRYLMSAGDLNRVDTSSLAEIGAELVGTYAERAAGEAEFFEGAAR
ncbi:hypothetical protein [Paraburkholderia terricola]|jgi:hypothetical protein|uniref:Uncharacterized protein n=1 Tax=Paraburkholderia terricola TaxID=169427 RepID=A0A1M6LH41_9BURK|nr:MULTISPECIES: hypothetical protein [Paraburkholderia]SDN86573.1 hypothetical protein SAMN05192547_1005113 [Paraburkholderia sediminicola]SHJ70524.1 hypothetical protein SAMN05192548_1005114 [Paraburkholderia terricola]